MDNIKILKKELEKNNIKYAKIEKYVVKKPCFWVDLLIYNENNDYDIVRLPAYSEKDYLSTNYTNIIKDKVKTLSI